MSTLCSVVSSRNFDGVLSEPVLAVQWREKSVIWVKAFHLDLVDSRIGESPPCLPLSFDSVH